MDRVIFLVVASCALLLTPGRSLQDCFEEQTTELVRRVSVSGSRLAALPRVMRAVQRTLDTVWPGSKVVLFGSLLAGLGSPDSDADLTVTLPGVARLDRALVERAAAAFRASPHLYQRIHERSRLPAVAVYYAPADIECDIHFRIQHYEMWEARLLNYLLHLDERALNLALIVKHWAKLHELVREKYLTTYTMMLTVIFFLQQRSILPTVVQLQNDIPVVVLNGTLGFNVAFEEMNVVSSNNESLYELAGAYFEYYDNFDFDNFVVSPFIGYPLPKSLFKDLDALPEEFYLYKSLIANNVTKSFQVTALCIQSLLILNDNCGFRVPTTSKIAENFKSAAQSYRESEKCDFLKGIGINVE